MNSNRFFLPAKYTPVLIAIVAGFASVATHAATIIISSRDAPGVGFNDPTPVAPVGGNPGTTLGEQRMNLYRHAANIWEAQLTSAVPITVSAGWEALSCTATQAVLGSAGAWNIWRDSPGATPDRWYPQALANKLAGVNLIEGNPDDGSGFGNVDIKTQFNVNLGNVGCLTGRGFYLGFDGNAGTQVNLLATLLHELGHGLGFSIVSVQTSTGNRLNATATAFVATGGVPSYWEDYMFDNVLSKTWLNMTSAERAASAIRPQQVAWIGANAVAGAATTLGPVPGLRVSTPVPNVSGFYTFTPTSFGPAPVIPSGFGRLQTPIQNLGCNPFNPTDTARLSGNVAIIDRGSCTFLVKATNAQNAGAIGVIFANNMAGVPPGNFGTAPAIVIPIVAVTQADGATLKTAVGNASIYGSRRTPGSVSASFTTNPNRLAGADALKRPLLFTPNPLQPGSSVSHWDTSAFPNQLMEPSISADLTTLLVPPKDLTFPLLRDLGW